MNKRILLGWFMVFMSGALWAAPLAYAEPETIAHARAGQEWGHDGTYFNFQGDKLLGLAIPQEYTGKIEGGKIFYSWKGQNNYSEVKALEYRGWDGSLWEAYLGNREDTAGPRGQYAGFWTRPRPMLNIETKFEKVLTLRYASWGGELWKMTRSQDVHLKKPCDFSIARGNNGQLIVDIQKCFGGSGNQCVGGDPGHPIVLDDTTCMATGFVTIGSIMHDNCCLASPKEGHGCDSPDGVSLFIDEMTGISDRRRCGQEWNKAWFDSQANRGWTVNFGPYYISSPLSGDNLTSVAPLRNGTVYDSHGQFPRNWKDEDTSDPSRWANYDDTRGGWQGGSWKGLSETVATTMLKAPPGTVFEFEMDAGSFCSTGNYTNIMEGNKVLWKCR